MDQGESLGVKCRSEAILLLPEILSRVFQHLGANDLLSCRRVCRAWLPLAQHHIESRDLVVEITERKVRKVGLKGLRGSIKVPVRRLSVRGRMTAGSLAKGLSLWDGIEELDFDRHAMMSPGLFKLGLPLAICSSLRCLSADGRLKNKARGWSWRLSREYYHRHHPNLNSEALLEFAEANCKGLQRITTSVSSLMLPPTLNLSLHITRFRDLSERTFVRAVHTTQFAGSIVMHRLVITAGAQLPVLA